MNFNLEFKNLFIKKRKIKELMKIKNNFFLNSLKMTNKKEIISKISEMIKETKQLETVYMELREGIGGIESEMFCEKLYKMYIKFFERKKILTEVISLKKTTNGIKRIVLRVKGKGIFDDLKDETGVHRIQRVPNSEKRGRVHTSTCIVEVHKVKEQVRSNINRREIKIETYKSSGPGGQSVNKTNSAVRITHIPTGIVVECQKERSQMENRRYAMNLLKAKIDKSEILKKEEKQKSIRENNKIPFSTRSAKIKTYNLVKNTIKNHLNGKKTNRVKEVLDGGRLEFI
ncbi:peptide chain release factor-like protein [Candidatus Vidania fulgoroideorum]